MGAWIEITQIIDSDGTALVAPAWGRGLKFPFVLIFDKFQLSPPHGGVD